MNITIRQLEIFVAVVRAESYTRAAQKIHLTQPAVSMQVKQLESQLEVVLFEQLGKKIYLTEAGSEVYHYARTVINQLQEMRTVLEEIKGLRYGKLRISVATTANYFAPTLLSTFYKRHPNVSVNLNVTNRQTLLQQLEENEVDLVIMGKPPSTMELEAEAFMENPLVIIAPPEHPLASAQEIKLSQLLSEIFLVREEGSGTRGAMERFFKTHHCKITTGMEISSDEAIKQSVKAGLGLGFLSYDAIQSELDLQQLTVLNVEHLPIRRYWYLVHRKGKRLSRFALAFKEFMIAEAPQILGKARIDGAVDIS
ncbi:MAG: LysR family transcriptional regulator [Gammaproteobacteria bacterium]|nr:LysR family transcriptional regulator [Gammaproteobacteria bacterium]